MKCKACKYIENAEHVLYENEYVIILKVIIDNEDCLLGTLKGHNFVIPDKEKQMIERELIIQSEIFFETGKYTLAEVDDIHWSIIAVRLKQEPIKRKTAKIAYKR